MMMAKVILVAALGVALLLGNTPGSLSATEHKVTIRDCGDTTDRDYRALQHPLPNAYTVVNGRLFSLGHLMACSMRLHQARLS